MPPSEMGVSSSGKWVSYERTGAVPGRSASIGLAIVVVSSVCVVGMWTGRLSLGIRGWLVTVGFVGG
jgi:hypothetical protein